MVESHARDRVGVLVLVNDVLALAAGVPDSDGLIQRAGDDLSVIGRESDGEDVLGVSGETVDGSAGRNLPETASTIPGGRECETRVASQLDLGNEVGVS